MASSKKTQKKWQRHRNAEKSRHVIERIWAEDGMVKTLDKKGNTQIKTVKEAAMYARELNKMFPMDLNKVPKELVPEAQRVHKFIQEIIKVCRDAASQKENDVGKAGVINNMYEGLTPDGKQLKPVTDEEAIIHQLTFQYPGLDFEDIRAIMRDEQLDPAQKSIILGQMHQEHMSAKFGFNS